MNCFAVADAPVRWLPETLVWHLGSDLTLELYRGARSPRPYSRGGDPGDRRSAAGGSLSRLDLAGGDDSGRGATAGEAARSDAGQTGLGGRFRAACCCLRRPNWPSSGLRWSACWRPRIPVHGSPSPRRRGETGTASARAGTTCGAMRQSAHPVPFRAHCRDGAGAGRVETAVTAALDASGCPIPGSTETIPVDAICVSFGFVPNIELAQVAGAALRFEPGCGGWTPQLDKNGQTTVPVCLWLARPPGSQVRPRP